MSHRMGWWGIQWVSGSQGDSLSPSLFSVVMDYRFLRFRPQFPFRGISLALLKTLSRSSPPSSNSSHDILILSGRNSSSRALRDFVGKVKDRRSHSIPENPRLIPAVVEREALYAPASRGLEAPRLIAISGECVRGGVYGSSDRLDFGPFFRYGVAWGRRG